MVYIHLKMKWWIVVSILVAECLLESHAANILALCTVVSHSHSLWCYRFMEALVERGHHVTVFGMDKPTKNIENLTTFIAEGVYEGTYNTEVTEAFRNSKSIISCMTYAVIKQYKYGTEAMLHSEGFKNLLKKYENISRPFDLIIHDHLLCLSCSALVHHFNNPPFVLATVYSVPEWWMIQAGNFPHPAYIPNIVFPASQHMTFYERYLNLFVHILYYYVYKYKLVPQNDQIMREVLGPDVPSSEDVSKNASILMVNYHPAIDGARPLLPGVIPIPGLHIDSPKPLPQSLQEYMDTAKHGVILLSFGSNADKSWLPESIEETLMKAFHTLPQRVLWKWENIPAGLPSNMRVEKWLPQNDILAHPNIQLFVTHCGILSSQEAVFHGVPMLTLPMFLDQYANAERFQRAGVSLTRDIATVTSDQLRQTITEMIQNPQYKRNMKRMGEQMRDTPLTSRQQAVFWIEYVIRHKGAPHLRSEASNMPWYQLLLLDILIPVTLVVFAFIWICKVTIIFLMRSLRPKTKSD